MRELLDAAFSVPNIIPTVLFLLVMVYWIIVIFGALDTNFLDFDLDHDVDVDVDAHVDLDHNVELSHEIDHDVDTHAEANEGFDISWLNHILVFFNLGKIPFMVFMSFMVMPMWLISIIANESIGNSSFLIGTALLIPNIIVCLFIAKVLTWPFVKMFEKMKHNPEDNISIIGKVCTTITTVTPDSLGQGEFRVEGVKFKINIKTFKGQELKKGETALIIEHVKDKKYYLVEPYKID